MADVYTEAERMLRHTMHLSRATKGGGMSMILPEYAALHGARYTPDNIWQLEPTPGSRGQ